MVSVTAVEDAIRTSVKTKRIRVSEFFQDFDRLRSGFITPSQFKRCLDHFVGIDLSEQQVDQLAVKYTSPKNGMVNYREFTDVIDVNFNPKKLDTNPQFQTNPSLAYLGTERSHLSSEVNVKEKVQSILLKIQNYYTYHGVNIRTSYEDFDRHHNGLVTKSQFSRSFPGPPDITEDEVMLLADYYKDPTKSNLTNYLNFHHDVQNLINTSAFDKISLAPLPSHNASAQHSRDLAGLPTDLKSIFEKIKVAVYKNGIRTKEFFKDHDKLRSGVITENQFLCGLSLGCGKEAHLSDQEIKMLADYYRTPDNRVQYKAFCDIMENAFNVPGLEKQPTIHPVAPPSGALTRSLAVLTGDEETQLMTVLSNLGEVVRKRRLMLYSYFKDYDRGVAYTRNVTKSQFARILHFLSLSVNEQDLKLLCKKFEEPVSGDVNYPAFCQAVDQEFNHYTIDKSEPVPSTDLILPPPPPSIDTSNVFLSDVMDRIRHHVLINRIRAGEFFQDFDPLRSGSITRAIFTRGIDAMDVSWLSKAQVHALLEMYADPRKSDCVLWTRFVSDVESVFTQAGLEKSPTHVVPPHETFLLPKEGALSNWGTVPSEIKDVFDEAMHRMRSRALQRRILAKPCFQDFDKHNNGHITKSQFRQCLATLDLHADADEVTAIEHKFSDDIGFNYLQFLNELIPKRPEIPKYKEHLKELQAANAQKKPREIDALTELNSILLKIKTKVCKERIRVYEFMKDYDKLKTGCLSAYNFERALDLAGLELKESEMKILASYYASFTHPGFINYVAFSDEIESIFTLKNLEKNPLTTPTPFKPPVEWQQNTLSEEEDIVYNMTMNRVAEQVRKTRTQLFPLFEDYDRVHNGTVSQSQFHRVLSELEMGSLLSEQEFRVIFAKFKVRIGGKDDVGYIPFCDRIYDIARFDPFKP